MKGRKCDISFPVFLRVRATRCAGIIEAKTTKYQVLSLVASTIWPRGVLFPRFKELGNGLCLLLVSLREPLGYFVTLHYQHLAALTRPSLAKISPFVTCTLDAKTTMSWRKIMTKHEN